MMNCDKDLLLPKRLLQLRKANEYSQQQIADALSISKPYYNRIENGERSISNEQLEQLSIFYDVNYTELNSLKLADRLKTEMTGYPLDVVNKAFEFINKKKYKDE